MQVVSAYDCHYPFINKPTLACMLDFVEQTKPGAFVFGGDQLDLSSISHHTKHKPLYRTERAYRNDIEGFDRNILGPVEAVLSKTAEKIWIIGNHEDWERQAIEDDPQLSGLIDHAWLLKLKARGWRIIPLGSGYRKGKLSFIHGEWLTGVGNQAGVMPAKKLVEIYASNVVAGHTHSPQSFARVSPVDQKNRWMGWISPVLCNLNPDYTRNRPKSWVNGFNVTEFRDDGGFNHYPVIVSGGKMTYGGKSYGRD